MKGKKSRRILSLVMSLCMVLSLLITNSSMVYAEGGCEFKIKLTSIDNLDSSSPVSVSMTVTYLSSLLFRSILKSPGLKTLI